MVGSGRVPVDESPTVRSDDEVPRRGVVVADDQTSLVDEVDGVRGHLWKPPDRILTRVEVADGVVELSQQAAHPDD